MITRLDLVSGVGSTGGGTDMSLWLIPVGIAAWFLVAIVVGLCVGPLLGRCSQAGEAAAQPQAREAQPQAREAQPQAREAAAQPWTRASGAHEPTWQDRQVSTELLGAGVGGEGIARRDQNVTL